MGDDLYTSVKAELDSVIEHYRALASDGMSFRDGWELASRAVASFVRIVTSASVAFADPDQKAAVLRAAGDFYDRVVAPLNIPWVPEFVEVSVVDPAMRVAFLKLADGLADAFAKIFARDRARAADPTGKFAPY